MKKIDKERRKHLDNRLATLNRRIFVIEEELKKLEDTRFYRTCIFGSARLKEDSPIYKGVEELAYMLAKQGIDILTGGGPGLMEAANKGAKRGIEESTKVCAKSQGNGDLGHLQDPLNSPPACNNHPMSRSFGISIELDFEPIPNAHLDIKRHHHKFSSRLDDFMRLSKSLVVAPGGIGTILELYFSWQLVQVKHIEKRPIVLMNKKFWTGIIEWMKDQPLSNSLISPGDLDFIHIVDTPVEAAKIILAHHHEFA